jgi:hypothetical protein
MKGAVLQLATSADCNLPTADSIKPVLSGDKRQIAEPEGALGAILDALLGEV